MLIRKLEILTLLALGLLLAAPLAMAADQNQQIGGHAVVTVDPGKETPGNIPQSALHLKLNGKESEITGFMPLRDPQSKVELVVLIDDGARGSLGTQMKGIEKFIQEQRPGTKIGVAYMLNGRAAFSQPLTTDLAAAAHGVHLPMAGGEGASSSPYFCLSDLAKNWPSNDAHARREVVMISDGIDYYNPRYDPNDPYVQAAMNDAVRAHLIIYTIYWRSQGVFDNTAYAAYDGQNLLAEVTETTGGKSYWQGTGNPVDFDPYFKDINQRIDNQYELDFMTAGDKPAIKSLKLTVSARAKLDAPGEVYVHPGIE